MMKPFAAKVKSGWYTVEGPYGKRQGALYYFAVSMGSMLCANNAVSFAIPSLGAC